MPVRKSRAMQRLAALFVRFFEYAVPDPYVFAVLLTVVTAVLAFALAPHHGGDVLAAWYKGIFDIFAFALQMILILVTGYALGAAYQFAAFCSASPRYRALLRARLSLPSSSPR